MQTPILTIVGACLALQSRMMLKSRQKSAPGLGPTRSPSGRFCGFAAKEQIRWQRAAQIRRLTSSLLFLRQIVQEEVDQDGVNVRRTTGVLLVDFAPDELDCPVRRRLVSASHTYGPGLGMHTKCYTPEAGLPSYDQLATLAAFGSRCLTADCRPTPQANATSAARDSLARLHQFLARGAYCPCVAGEPTREHRQVVNVIECAIARAVERRPQVGHEYLRPLH